MDRSAANVNYTPWRSSSMNGPTPLPAMAGAEWDHLLGRIGLTDAEALAAVRDDTEAGQRIRSFVQWAFRERFVPEDVLLAMNLQREANQAKL